MQSNEAHSELHPRKTSRCSYPMNTVYYFSKKLHIRCLNTPVQYEHRKTEQKIFVSEHFLHSDLLSLLEQTSKTCVLIIQPSLLSKSFQFIIFVKSSYLYHFLLTLQTIRSYREKCSCLGKQQSGGLDKIHRKTSRKKTCNRHFSFGRKLCPQSLLITDRTINIAFGMI